MGNELLHIEEFLSCFIFCLIIHPFQFIQYLCKSFSKIVSHIKNLFFAICIKYKSGIHAWYCIKESTSSTIEANLCKADFPSRLLLVNSCHHFEEFLKNGTFLWTKGTLQLKSYSPSNIICKSSLVCVL